MKDSFHSNYNNKSGIYKIVNQANGKIYIGSAVNLYDRKARHWYDFRVGHYNIKLRRAKAKYGIRQFKFEIIELVEIKDLLTREQFYLDKFRPDKFGYNILSTAGSCLGNKVSDITKAKIRNSKLGKKMPEKQRLALIKIRTGWKFSDETKRKIGLANRDKYIKSVIQLDLSGKIVREFTSIKEASLQTKINASNLGQCCLGKRSTAGKYLWKFKNES